MLYLKPRSLLIEERTVNHLIIYSFPMENKRRKVPSLFLVYSFFLFRKFFSGVRSWHLDSYLVYIEPPNNRLKCHHSYHASINLLLLRWKLPRESHSLVPSTEPLFLGEMISFWKFRDVCIFFFFFFVNVQKISFCPFHFFLFLFYFSIFCLISTSRIFYGILFCYHFLLPT